MKEKEQFEVRDLREKDQFKIDDKFLNGYAKYVEIYAVGVYNSLCRHAQFKSQRAFPSAEKIAEELNISSPKVFYSIWVLEIFNIIKRYRIGKGCNNRYDLLHKKHWKYPSEICKEIKSDINTVNISDVNTVNITYKRHLHHLLTTLTSNSKDNKSKDNKGKELRSPSAHALLVKYFFDKVVQIKKYKPDIAGKDGELLKRTLHSLPPAKIEKLIDWYVSSDECKKLGASLSICLSANIKNKWREIQTKTNWQM